MYLVYSSIPQFLNSLVLSLLSFVFSLQFRKHLPQSQQNLSDVAAGDYECHGGNDEDESEDDAWRHGFMEYYYAEEHCRHWF